MKAKTLIFLACLAAAVVVVATLLARRDRPAVSPTAGGTSAARLFPGLDSRINDVALINVQSGDKSFTLKKGAAGWELPDKGGYPAKLEEVVRTLRGLTDLREGEAKTSKPELYSKIGVQDPDGKPAEPAGGGPTLLTLRDAADQVVAAVIVGNSRPGTPAGVYIRKAGEAQSWLAEGQLEIPADPVRWIDAQFVNIPRERLKGVTITQPDGETLRVSRAKPEDASFTVHDVPAGKELRFPTAGDELGSAISFLSLEDVAPVATIDFEGKSGGNPGAYGEFRTFDGLMIATQLTEKDGKTWIKVAAYSEAPEPPKAPEGQPEAPRPPGKSPDEVKKEADELNARLSRWAFQIPQYKATSLQKRMADVLKSDAPPTPPPAMEGTTPLFPPQPAPVPKGG